MSDHATNQLLNLDSDVHFLPDDLLIPLHAQNGNVLVFKDRFIPTPLDGVTE